MSKNRLLFLVLMLILSCNQKKGDKVNVELQEKIALHTRDSIINRADTINNKPIGHGFYRNEKGDIFELKRTGYGQDGENEPWTAIQFLDSTLIVDSWEDRKAIKNYLDIDTYTEDRFANYSTDKKYVYYVRASSDGFIRWVVKGADPNTFIGIQDRWGKDSKHVFYEMDIVKGADPKTIRVFGVPSDSARDKKGLYVRGERVK